jgi:hypothetical protein
MMWLFLTFVGFGLAVFFGALVWKLTRDDQQRSAARVAALSGAIDDATAADGDVGVDVQPTFFMHDRPPTSQSGLIKLAVGLAGCVALIVVIATLSTSTSQAERSPAAGASSIRTPDGALELLSMRYQRDGDAITVTGLVRNGGSTPTDRVIAVVFTFDRNGNFVASGRAPLEFAALAPGDESPFRISIPGVGDIGRYRVSFRTEAGVIRHIDRRQALLARGTE